MATEAKTQAEGTETTQTEKVVFDERQQARVDELIKEAMGRAGKEARREAERIKSEMETRLSEMQAKLEAKPKSQQSKSDSDDVEALRAQIEEMKTASATTRDELERYRKLMADKEAEVERTRKDAINIQKRAAMTAAAQKFDFLDLSDVLSLTDSNVRWDETRNTFTVVNEQGTERMNAAYEPMTLEEFYQEYSKKKPHLVKGNFKGGAGSKPADGTNPQVGFKLEDLFGPKSDSRLANELAMKDKEEYKRLKKIAQKQRLIA